MSLPKWLAELPPEKLVAFDVKGVIPTPVAGPETDILVLQVPNGYSCFIGELAHGVTGPFTEGSGDMLWNIRTDSQAHPYYSRQTTQIGTFGIADTTYGIFAKSRQVMRYSCINFNVGIGTNVFARLKGVFYKP